eukprot:7065437-Lingulodinium_polyedra.AAC.1
MKNDPNKRFRFALTSTEENWLQQYEANYPGAVVMLGQNPCARPMASSDYCLQTVIRNAGMMWKQARENYPMARWFFPRELLLTQGLPTFPGLAP